MFGAKEDLALFLITDGAAAGTQPVSQSVSLAWANGFVAAEGRVHFRSYSELFVSDGSEAGTVELLSHSLGEPAFIPARGGVVFDNGDLWWSQGTPQSTVSLFEQPPGPATFPGLQAGDYPNSSRVGDRMYFIGRDELHGTPFFSSDELWGTDGTPTGTNRAFDPDSGGGGEVRVVLGEVAGRAVFGGETLDGGSRPG